jgi:hypothetical protein
MRQLILLPFPHCPHRSEEPYQELQFCGGLWDNDGNADLANPICVLLKVFNFRNVSRKESGRNFDRNVRSWGA